MFNQLLTDIHLTKHRRLVFWFIYLEKSKQSNKILKSIKTRIEKCCEDTDV